MIRQRAQSAGFVLPTIGWREWVALPELGVERIKCKVDTGARTSALHAFAIERYSMAGEAWIRFALHPHQQRTEPTIHCVARIADERIITDSGGHRERRVVITTPITIGSATYPIELTLTTRDTMRFRMLLGRTAISKHFMVNPASSYLANPALGRKTIKRRKL